MFQFKYALREKGGKLSYSMPGIYYAVTGGVLGVLLATLLLVMGTAEFLWWAMFGFALLVVLAEDRWTFDATKGTIRHRYGLLPFARSFTLPFDRIASVSFVDESARILDPDDLVERNDKLRAGLAKAGRPGFVSLEFQLVDGIAYTFLVFPKRFGPSARDAAKRMAEYMAKPFFELLPEPA